MFLGHFAMAYGAKHLAPRASLGTLFAAAQLPDVVWPWLVIGGVEHATIAPGDTAFTPLRFDSYPVSHSLVTVALWGAAFGAVHFWRQRRRLDAVVLALLAVSHWLLDFVSHRPDMPLWPDGPKVGLGLWNSVAATIAVELLLFAGGLWLCVSATRPRDGLGRWGFVAPRGAAARHLRRERHEPAAAEHGRRRLGRGHRQSPVPRARGLGRPAPRAAGRLAAAWAEAFASSSSRRSRSSRCAEPRSPSST